MARWSESITRSRWLYASTGREASPTAAIIDSQSVKGAQNTLRSAFRSGQELLFDQAVIAVTDSLSVPP